MRHGTRTLRRPCPFCDGSAGRPVWSEGGYDYVRCTACGGVFTDVDQETYEGARHNVWDEPAPDEGALGFYGDARSAAHMGLLDRFPPWGRAKLLDVGCGLGFFLERAQGRGWQVHGCEPSPSWAKLAQQRLGPDRVTRGAVHDLAQPEDGFDLITAWDVIEHVFEPVHFLRALRHLLRPGGRVFLRTPNLDYVLPVYRLRRKMGQGVELGPLNHVVYFTPRSMRRALGSAGFEPDRWLALPPPQVATFETEPSRRYAPDRSAVISIKNAWSCGARAALKVTGGWLAIASDLDVVTRPAESMR